MLARASPPIRHPLQEVGSVAMNTGKFTDCAPEGAQELLA